MSVCENLRVLVNNVWVKQGQSDEQSAELRMKLLFHVAVPSLAQSAQ